MTNRIYRRRYQSKLTIEQKKAKVVREMAKPEERAARLKLMRDSARLRRLNQTPEEKLRRLEKERASYAAKTAEKREQRKALQAAKLAEMERKKAEKRAEKESELIRQLEALQPKTEDETDEERSARKTSRELAAAFWELKEKKAADLKQYRLMRKEIKAEQEKQLRVKGSDDHPDVGSSTWEI